MNCQVTCLLFQWLGYMSPTGEPFSANWFSEACARSMWYGSSLHQAFPSSQLSATSMSSVAPLYLSETQDPFRQNGWFGAPSLTPVQKLPIVTCTQRPQFSPLSNMPISAAFAAEIGRGTLV